MTAGGAASEGDAPHALEAAESSPLVVRRRSGRRVSTDPVPGSDPTPAPESARQGSSENDQRLRADVPPHWG
ncbi:hypothetical protein IFT36_08465 [Frigoribacterium sp. CFBP 13605]|uniref:hypothetical protein n=1 Tax=Frigoribacterium sp. CFBP 13605 TaxID=2774034 RepID=UPI0019050036|nr:hypothetical protein [Frigoribacterium sp. CFBP 13605]MBD8140574.1 hypothetical protein [Frigoribacterium sp. CFBP 13605]